MVIQLPDDVWLHIYDILAEQQRDAAATSIQAHFRGFVVRIGPLRYVLRYIRKGRLSQARAAYSHAQRQV